MPNSQMQSEDEDDGLDELIDSNILSRIKFQQISERKSWQGLNVNFSGVPGTTTLIPNEGILMFTEERQEMDAQDKIVDVFREFLDIILGSAMNVSNFNQNNQLKAKRNEGAGEGEMKNNKLVKLTQNYSLSNQHFIRFKVFEMM